MLKPALALGLLALGAIAASGPAKAGSPAGLSGARVITGSTAPPACAPGRPCQSNQQFRAFRAPRPGETVLLNPQPLPPKQLFLRR